jgi:rubredoxin
MAPNSPASKAWVKARVSYGRYECNICKGVFGPTQMAKDHEPPIEPIQPEPFSWDAHIERLFWGSIQVVCRECHARKTKNENSERRKAKKNAKV